MTAHALGVVPLQKLQWCVCDILAHWLSRTWADQEFRGIAPHDMADRDAVCEVVRKGEVHLTDCNRS